jgi:hypothetical protein
MHHDDHPGGRGPGVVRGFPAVSSEFRRARVKAGAAGPGTRPGMPHLGGIVEIVTGRAPGRVAPANLERLDDLRREAGFAAAIRETMVGMRIPPPPEDVSRAAVGRRRSRADRSGRFPRHRDSSPAARWTTATVGNAAVAAVQQGRGSVARPGLDDATGQHRPIAPIWGLGFD